MNLGGPNGASTPPGPSENDSDRLDVVPLDTLLARHANCRRDRVALVFGAQRLTHSEIDRRALERL